MMVISLPNGILALKLCTEKKSCNFLCQNGQECNTFFFKMKIENPFLPSKHIKD